MVDRNAAAKFELLREIFAMTQEQRAALVDDDIERFHELLADRETLIGHLRRVAAGEDLPPNVIPFPGSDPVAARQDELALDTLIRSVMRLDEEHQELLHRRLTEVGAELPGLHDGSRGIRRYRVEDSAPRFIDRAS